MANLGVPPGGQYPSRQELGAQLRPYLDNPRSLGANIQSARYAELNDIYANTDQFYQPNQQQTADAEDMVVLSDVPTSSTNYSRPRTVAAGYDAERHVMTVVFRDGTFYNYYEVTPGEWQNFSTSFSKGSPWLNRGFPHGKQKMDGLFIGKPRGNANISDVAPEIREQLYRVSRTQQIRHKPLQSVSQPGKVAGYKSKATGKAPGNPADRKRKP